MSDTISQPEPQQRAAPSSIPADSVYRPLSGLALAAMVVSSLYALVMVVVLGAAWWWKMSPFMGLWTLVIPLAAGALALMAHQQIRQSEGTRSGQSLVTWSAWLSALFGLSYAGYYVATYVSINLQSGQFAEDWFAKIQNSEVAAAFLLTQAPEERQDVSPGDKQYMDRRYGRGSPGRKAPLPAFKETELVRILQQGGPDVNVTSRGIRDWDYGEGGYHVQRLFRIETPEGTFDVQVGLRSDERKTRRWRILEGETSIQGTPALSPRGQAIQRWRDDARRFAGGWTERRNQGDIVGLYLDSREAHERPRLARNLQARALASQFAAQTAVALGDPLAYFWAAPLDPAPVLPGYKDFLSGSLIHTQDFDASEKLRADVLKDLESLLRSPHLQFRMSQMSNAQPLPAEGDGKRMRFAQDIEFNPPPPAAQRPPRFVGEARLIVESDPGSVTPERRPQWRWLRLELIRASDPLDDPRARQGGPPSGP